MLYYFDINTCFRRKQHSYAVCERCSYSKFGYIQPHLTTLLLTTRLQNNKVKNIILYVRICLLFIVMVIRSDSTTLNWAAPNEAFPVIEKLLSIKGFQYYLLLGISISAGGMTESLVSYLLCLFLHFFLHHNLI